MQIAECFVILQREKKAAIRDFYHQTADYLFVGGVSLAVCFHGRMGAAARGAVERCVLVAGASD